VTTPGRFAGKIALVTGSTQGIGEAAARRFAAEGAAGMVVTGRNPERGAVVVQALTALGTEAIFVPADLADPAQCRALIVAADSHFSRLDVLVNAAALTDRGNIVDTTVELWDRLIAVNLRAPFLLMQGAIAIMRREHIPGTIVSVGSVSAYGSVPMLLPYAVSKSGLMTLTRNVAYSVMWDRIRVNLHVDDGGLIRPQRLAQRLGELAGVGDEVPCCAAGSGDNIIPGTHDALGDITLVIKIPLVGLLRSPASIVENDADAVDA